LDQGRILILWVDDGNIILGNQESVGDLPLGGEGFAAAGGSEDQAVRLFVKRNFSRDGKNQAGKAP
jgi:hypothetical protein